MGRVMGNVKAKEIGCRELWRSLGKNCVHVLGGFRSSISEREADFILMPLFYHLNI